MHDHRSEWQAAKQQMADSSITLGSHLAYWLRRSPRRLLHSMSYYKFAAKMIGRDKRVLDLGCGEGIGSYLLSKECGFAHGIDFDAEAINYAQSNFGSTTCQFSCTDFLATAITVFDAVVNFDVIEHIAPAHANSFLQRIATSLPANGIAIIGTPSQISQTFASEIAKAGHINIYSADRLESELRAHFHHVMIFAANDELVHTGYLPLAHYYIALCCRPK